MDMWECDLLHVKSLEKWNDTHIYILSVIDVLLKYLHLVPVRTKTGRSVTSAFSSIFTSSVVAPYGYLRKRARNF